MKINEMISEYNKINENLEPSEAELDDIYEAAQILYREMDKEYYEEEEKEILSKAYDILRNYSTEV